VAAGLLEQGSLELSSSPFPMRKGVRLLGVTLSSLTTEEKPASRQLPSPYG